MLLHFLRTKKTLFFIGFYNSHPIVVNQLYGIFIRNESIDFHFLVNYTML